MRVGTCFAVGAVLLGTAFATAAAEPEPAPRVRVVTKPDWASVPRYQDLEPFYPAEAAQFEVAGRGVIECRVRADGTLEACAVSEETPSGWGFGAATLAVAQFFRMRPVGESLAGGRVRVPLRWTPEGNPDNRRLCAAFEAGRPGRDRKARIAAFQAAMEAEGEEPGMAKARANYLPDVADRLNRAYPERMADLLAQCRAAKAGG
ncbi:energy transducer TonB [Caulobacter sp. 17J65-9]|uniref:energy transducer TonB n=1 Tax=Caulobacter sp. 17J65-9 TaxID=2709382 RepID=UPI0013CBED12|nr:energy transducer TonB [Caulobacter sp. 17J65-9]NEX93858.1 hypothetical protein [Caulobacter sp. 17J65-9]